MKYTYQQLMAMDTWTRYDAIQSMTQKERDAMNASAVQPKLTDKVEVPIEVAEKVIVTPVAEVDCVPTQPIKKNLKGRWLSK